MADYYMAKNNTKCVLWRLWISVLKIKSTRYTLDQLADLFHEPLKWPRWQGVKDWDSQLNEDFQND